jgi:hypothetical protein
MRLNGTVYELRGGDVDGNGSIQQNDLNVIASNPTQATEAPSVSYIAPVTTGQITTLEATLYLQSYWNNATTTHSLTAVLIELRTGADIATSVVSAAQAGIINSSGVVTVDFPGLSSGDYWIVIRHGGHLGIASANRATITAGTSFSYDFTTSQNQAYRGQWGFAVPMRLNGTVYELRGGDSDGNGSIPTQASEVMQP